MTNNHQQPVTNTPITYALAQLNPTMGTLNGMKVALEFEGALIENARKSMLGITDVSCFSRVGIKGPQAVKWLASQDIKTPADINSWIEHNGTLVLRLGGSEFLVEERNSGLPSEKLASFDQATTTGVYKVQRADASFILSGSEALNMLSELCMMDLRDSALGANTVVMTQVAGISATLLRQQLNGEQVYRLWCDGTYGSYMWDMLLEVAGELGGGAVGLFSHYK